MPHNSLEAVRELDSESLQAFAEKGTQGGAGILQCGNANGVKVRRVMQIISDLASRPFSELRILDVACGEGVYSIEAALRGAEVLGFDARTERMSQGIRCAEVNGLSNVQFQIDDVRKLSRAAHGEFDVILFLGILYHLDVPDVFHVLESLHELCREFVIIDTHISLQDPAQVEHRGRTYSGRQCREHQDGDSAEVRQSRVLMSIDNTFAFQFTRESLVRLLSDMGFTSVFECHAPLEPGKTEHRATFVARKGRRVKTSTYPWINGLTEQQIAERLQPQQTTRIDANQHPAGGRTAKQLVRRGLNKVLRPVGYEVRRV